MDRNDTSGFVSGGCLYLGESTVHKFTYIFTTVSAGIMVQGLDNFNGAMWKWNPVEGRVTFNIGASLDLGLTLSGVTSNCSAKSTTACSTLRSGRELDSPVLDSSMDFGLHLGLKETRNEVRSSSLNFGEQESAKFKVDLDLSLSIGAAESDVTSITLASSPVQARSDIQVASSMVQLVDEGSTSSKWRGPLLHPLMNAFPNLDTPMVFDSYPNMKDPFSCALSLPSSNIGLFENPVPVANPGSNERRKISVKTCQFPGCSKGARGASGLCISHGGGRRCKREGCQKGAEGKTVFCKAHGGGRRCEQLGCTRSAEGRTDFCITHGGGRRCSYQEGCQRAARGSSGLCIRHGGGKRCKVENCSKSAEGLSGRCIAHGGGRRCQYSDCPKGAQGSTKYCKAHGGGKRCTFSGCNKGAEGSTQLCKGHGGGKRCSFNEGCMKSVHGGTLFCVAHGGGKRCAVPDCSRSARGKTNCCVRHGGGKRCQHEGCCKSAQGSTDFCKAHGGGRRCLWGQPGSQFDSDVAAAPCDKFARGKIGLCAAHSDRCVHGDSTAIHILQGCELTMSKKGKEIVMENAPFTRTYNTSGEGSSFGWNVSALGGNGHYSMATNVPPNGNLLNGEGRVHGGGLMAMLRENLLSFELSPGNQPVGSPLQPVARNCV